MTNKDLIPRIALRKKDGKLDDIVVADVDSVHLEDMGQGWWLGINLLNGDRICFWIGSGRKLIVSLYEKPNKPYQDWDKWHKKKYSKSYKESK